MPIDDNGGTMILVSRLDRIIDQLAVISSQLAQASLKTTSRAPPPLLPWTIGPDKHANNNATTTIDRLREWDRQNAAADRQEPKPSSDPDKLADEFAYLCTRILSQLGGLPTVATVNCAFGSHKCFLCYRQANNTIAFERTVPKHDWEYNIFGETVKSNKPVADTTTYPPLHVCVDHSNLLLRWHDRVHKGSPSNRSHCHRRTEHKESGMP